MGKLNVTVSKCPKGFKATVKELDTIVATGSSENECRARLISAVETFVKNCYAFNKPIPYPLLEAGRVGYAIVFSNG